MGDRTYYAVGFTYDPAKLSKDDVKTLCHDVLEFESFECAHMDRDETMGGSYDYVHMQDTEYTVGEAMSVARKILDWMNKDAPARLTSFSVQEDPYADWLGTYVTYEPGQGFHSVDCDASGNAVINQTQLSNIWSGNDTIGIAAELERYFGPKSSFPAPKALGRWPDKDDVDQMIDFNRWKTEVVSDETTLGFQDWLRNESED